MLGNDVTLQPEVMASGASFVKAYNEPELKRLLWKKARLGQKMFIEDLDALAKGIKYLKVKVKRKMISDEKPDFRVHDVLKPKKSCALSDGLV